MSDSIPISLLKGLKVELENNLFELAQFVLKVQLGRDSPTLRERTTVNGLIAHYEYLLQINGHLARDLAMKHGLPLDASIMLDKEHTEWQEMLENCVERTGRQATRR